MPWRSVRSLAPGRVKTGSEPSLRPDAAAVDEGQTPSDNIPADVTGGPADRLAARRRAVATVACYLAAAIILTWRLWADPASRIVAGNPDDADLFAWFMRYAAEAIAHGHLPALVTATLNAPAGVNLMWNSSTLLPCIVLAPVTLLFGPQASLTLLTTIGFAGSATAMFWVLRRWRVTTPAAALAGAVYGFSPALLQSSIGHYDLQLAIAPPLIVDALLRLAVPPRSGDGAADRQARPRAQLRDGIRLGLLVAAQLFISEELALTTALTGLLMLGLLAACFPRAAIRQAMLTVYGLLVALSVTLILAGWALRIQFDGPLTQSGSPFLRDFYVNDLTGFVTPSSFLLFHTSASAAAAAAYQGQAPEYLAYLGWPLIIAAVLALVVFWRHPPVRILGATAVVLALFSLGGHPLISGTTHQGVALPWHWIEELPLGGSVLPDRLSILVDGAVAATLAFALDLSVARFRPARATLAWAAAVLACLPLVPLPLPATAALPLPAGWTAAFAALRLPSDARVLVVPVPEVHLTAAMRWEAQSRQQFSLIGGYYIGPAWNGLAYVDGNGLTPTSAYLDELWAAGLRPGSALAVEAAAAGLQPPASPPAKAQVAADLSTWQPAAVVAVTSKGSALARYLTTLFGRPVSRTGGVLAWRR